MTLVREFNLYLTAGRTIPLVINVNQFDSGEQWAFTIYKEDGTQYIPSTGAIVGIKSDNLGIINSGTVDENGRVIITETQQMTASVGKAVFELTLDSGTHGTANFVVLVEEKPGNNADLSDSDISLIQEALNAVSPLPTGGTVGQVLTKTAQGSVWSDAGTPTQEQVAEAVSDWADENITVSTGVVIDTSLSVAGAAADAKATGDAISTLQSQIASGGGFNAEVKSALDQFTASVLQLAEKVAYIDENGQDYYDDIDDAADALHSAMYPPANLSYITAVYTQSGTVYADDSLDSLKSDLVVTAHYSDSTTAVITNYTLSGTLTVGTSTVTVTYGGKTTTFTVTVTAGSRYINLISETGTYVSGRSGKNGDEITITSLGDYWYHIATTIKSKWVTLNISEVSENLNTTHPLVGLDEFADITGREIHIDINNIVCSNSTSAYFWSLMEAPVNNVDSSHNLTPNYYGTESRELVVTSQDDKIGGIGLYVDREMTLSFDIRLLAY